MAGDSEITVGLATRNAFADNVAGVAVLSSTAAAYIDVSTMDGSKLLILASAAAGAKRPTIVVEDGAEYSAGAVGNIEQLTTAGGTYNIVVETARCKDSNGYINITKDTTDTTPVTVSAILLP